MDLSVIIPARNEVYLQKTIENVLANIQGDTEIIAVCDGYWPEPAIQDHPRITLIHHTESIGQRAAINEAARLSKAKFIMKLDAHCAVGPGFDRILCEDYQPGWTLVPTMYNLDAEKWEPKLHKKTTAMYIGMSEGRELRAEYYNSHPPKFDTPIHETMCCMGPGWFIDKDLFWELGGCDEQHGGWGQQGVEVALKAWLSGGALMTDENTWFAHWFRGGGGPGFPYPLSGHAVDAARQYSRDLWLNNKWPHAKRTLQWLVEKFNPPGWERRLEQDKALEINTYLYAHLHKYRHEPYWRGVHCVKMPSDMILYHMAIWQARPEVIVEIGTYKGGSCLYLQDQLDLLGEGGKVITIDIQNRLTQPPDPRVLYLYGNSTSKDMVNQIRELTAGKRTMFSIDGNHDRVHVKWELHHYAPLVTSGQYLVLEDCYAGKSELFGPGQARDWFLSSREGKDFVNTNMDKEFLVGLCLGGWLKRKA